MRSTGKRVWLAVALLAGLCLATGGAGRAHAADRPLEFLQALRNRDYFDYALLLLDQLETKPGVDPEVREVLAYERGMTLLEQARGTRDSDQQTRLYDLARVEFEKFLKEHPEHPLAGSANSEAAEVLTGKAKALVLQANSPNNAGRKPELLAQARDLLGQATKVFQAAFDRYKAEYDKFDKFIPATDKARYAARERVFLNYVKAQFNLARMVHEEAQTYDRGSPENKAALIKAANAFEAIHAQHRSLVVGLYARLWQGKCFEEMDELTKALGIYNELLEHQGKSDSPLEDLQARVLQFRLVCLNHEQRKDSQVVAQEAQAWLKANRSSANTRVGLGIQWELTRGLEQLARGEDLETPERNRILQQALDTARKINRYPGEYKDASTAMIRRLLAALDRGSGDPRDFATAFSLARTQVDEIRNKNSQAQQAQGAEKQALQAEIVPLARETARTLTLALKLAGKRDDAAEVNRARYFLAYVDYLLRDRSYDAGVLAEHVARTFRKQQPDLALDAAYLAQAAYIQAYHRESRDKRGPEIAWVVGICNYITEHWPNSDKAQDARLNLGGLYAELGQPAEAARWYGSVPEASPQYLDAQLKAGGAWWNVYVQELTRPEAERKPREQIDELLNQSRNLLSAAIGKLEGQLPQQVAQVEPARLRDLAIAKLTLATILNGAGDYKGALTLLADAPLAAVPALPAFTPGTKPYVDMAVLTYIQVLRAHIGANDLVKAQAAQKELDNIVSQSGGGGKALTQVYIDFGSQLKKEVQRLQSARDPRLAEVLKSFETFLDEVSKRKEGQSYYSLRWIGETYRDLGEGLSGGDRPRAEGYFGKAIAAYRQILDEDAKAPGFIPSDQATGVELSIIRCQRLQQTFADAEKGLLKLLKARPKALDAQEEAARLYADWAATGGKGDLTRWNLAIEGDQNLKSRKPENRVVWGWSGIATRLENSLSQGAAKSSGGEDLEAKYFQARYETALTRLNWSRAEPTEDKRRARLATAYRDVRLTATTMPGMGGDESYERFNKLFKDIQQDMLELGKFDEVAKLTAPADLERREISSAGKTAKKKKPKPTAEATAATPDAGGAKTAAKSATTPAAGGGSTLLPLLAGLAGLAALVGGLFFVLKKQGKKRRPVAESVELPPAGAPARPAARPAVKAPRPAPTEGATAASAPGVAPTARPASPRPATAQPNSPRPAPAPSATEAAPARPAAPRGDAPKPAPKPRPRPPEGTGPTPAPPTEG